MEERGFGEDREDRGVSERMEPISKETQPDEMDRILYRATLRQLHDHLIKEVRPGDSKSIEIGQNRIEVQRSDEGNTVISINDEPIIESQNGIVGLSDANISTENVGLLNMSAVAIQEAFEYERRRIKRETDDRTANRERRDEADSRGRNIDGDESPSYDIEDEDRYADCR